MSALDCSTAREMIPDVAGGRADADAGRGVEEHASACDGCRGELRLARALYASRATAPEGLADRVLEGVRHRRRTFHRPWWGVSAAATAALALGIGITSRPADEGAPADVAVESEEAELWLSEDGFLAGAPVLDALSDEALAELLESLIPASSGGQA